MQMRYFATRIVLLFAVLTAVLCLIVFSVRAQQLAFRHRAERLQYDLQRAEYRKTTLAQLLPVFHRWSASYNGPCRDNECSAQMTIGDFAYRHADFFSNHQRLFRAYGFLGGRPAIVRAAVAIKGGVVRAKSYAIYVEVFPKESEHGGNTPLGYSLIGETSLVESLPLGRSSPLRHPSYWIGWPSGCEICIAIEVHATPDAPPEDIQRLNKLDFSCLTRWFQPCRDKGDIMPEAWAQVQKEDLS